MKQIKNKAKLASTNIEIIIIKFEEEEISLSINFIQIQPHLIYAIDEVFNPENTNKKKILSKNYNKINILTALTD